MPEDDPIMGRLVERAERLARANGLGDGLASVADPDWPQLLARVEGEGGADLPAGWRQTLTTARDRARLNADGDDTRLAEEGEVFSREDDA